MSKRIFYASHGVSIDGTSVQGAQSVAVNTNFNLEQVFQLGRLAIYDNIASDPDVEITLSKALDGHSSIWGLFALAGDKSLVGNAEKQSTIVLGVGQETDDALTSMTSAITMTGCYVSSLNYTFPVDGDFIEEVTFVGSHKQAGGTVSAPSADPSPKILRRQNFEGGNLPAAVTGKRISNITVSADLGREKMFALGELSPFHRFVNFPLEVTISFDVIQDGNSGTSLVGPHFDEIHVACSGAPITTEPITLAFCDSTGATTYSFNFGNKCSLQSVSYSGGDTGGGNVTETYTYITYNDFTLTDS